MGEVLCCLTSKCLSRYVQEEAFNILTPLQLGVGVRVGCETIVHLVASTLEDPSIPSNECWTLLLDFKNAFNCISREAMFVKIRARVPSLSAWFECCYGIQPILHLGDEVIRSCSGVQQGDLLGPLGFALMLHPVVERIKSEVANLRINAWYFDDGTMCVYPSELAMALKIIEEEGLTSGLFLNRAKSLFYIPADDEGPVNPHPSEIPTTGESFVLFGRPIGPPSFNEAAVLNRVEKVKEILSKLQDLEDAQMEASLLWSCLTLPKISFSLRTCPPPPPITSKMSVPSSMISCVRLCRILPAVRCLTGHG